MLSNAPISGLDLMALMADTAAAWALARLPGGVRLSACESFRLAEGFAVDDVEVESWAVVEDRQAVTVSVFATAPQQGGGRRMAGSGRFTFTTLPSERKFRA